MGTTVLLAKHPHHGLNEGEKFQGSRLRQVLGWLFPYRHSRDDNVMRVRFMVENTGMFGRPRIERLRRTKLVGKQVFLRYGWIRITLGLR